MSSFNSGSPVLNVGFTDVTLVSGDSCDIWAHWLVLCALVYKDLYNTLGYWWWR